MSLPRDETSSLAPSSHEEADTRMFLHAADAIQSSFTKIIVRSVDTDVLVLVEALVQKLQALASENSGWHLVLGNIFAILQPTRLPTHLLTIDTLRSRFPTDCKP